MEIEKLCKIKYKPKYKNILIYFCNKSIELNKGKVDLAKKILYSLTTVVSVKMDDIRRQGYKSWNEWESDKNNVYIGRGNVYRAKINGKYVPIPSKSSKWANPYKISDKMSRDEVLTKYKEYIIKKIKEDPKKYNIEELRGKNLGCWCKTFKNPQSCHGDILKELIKSITSF